jgi:hypothetical protein
MEVIYFRLLLCTTLTETAIGGRSARLLMRLRNYLDDRVERSVVLAATFVL